MTKKYSSFIYDKITFKDVFEKIIIENFPKLMKGINLQNF